jgi:hypothetical protein
LTTPENTNEVLRILSTIKLEYDLDAVDQKKGGLSSKKLYLLRNPWKKKYYKQCPQSVHVKALKLELTFQAIPSLQSARTQGEGIWNHRERSRKCQQSSRRVPERSS